MGSETLSSRVTTVLFSYGGGEVTKYRAFGLVNSYSDERCVCPPGPAGPVQKLTLDDIEFIRRKWQKILFMSFCIFIIIDYYMSTLARPERHVVAFSSGFPIFLINSPLFYPKVVQKPHLWVFSFKK